MYTYTDRRLIPEGKERECVYVCMCTLCICADTTKQGADGGEAAGSGALPAEAAVSRGVPAA